MLVFRLESVLRYVVRSTSARSRLVNEPSLVEQANVVDNERAERNDAATAELRATAEQHRAVARCRNRSAEAEELKASLEGLPTRPLASAQEQELLALARRGDEHALRVVAESYLRRTAVLALAYAPDSLPLVDAMQEASVALVRLLKDETVHDPHAALSPAIHDAFRAVERREVKF